MKFKEATDLIYDIDGLQLFYDCVDMTKEGESFTFTSKDYNDNLEPDEEAVEDFHFRVEVFQKDMNVYDGARSYIYLKVADKFYVCFYDYSSWEGTNWSGPEEVDPPKQKTVWVFE